MASPRPDTHPIGHSAVCGRRMVVTSDGTCTAPAIPHPQLQPISAQQMRPMRQPSSRPARTHAIRRFRARLGHPATPGQPATRKPAFHQILASPRRPGQPSSQSFLQGRLVAAPVPPAPPGTLQNRASRYSRRSSSSQIICPPWSDAAVAYPYCPLAITCPPEESAPPYHLRGRPAPPPNPSSSNASRVLASRSSQPPGTCAPVAPRWDGRSRWRVVPAPHRSRRPNPQAPSLEDTIL